MFRLRQHNEGAIELLPDTPPPPVARPLTPSQTIDQTTLLSEATRGTTAARHILSTANEAHSVAVETAERLQQQTKQLENIAMVVDDTRGHLDSAEVTIEKLTRPIWRRKIGRRGGGAGKTVDRKIGLPRFGKEKEKENIVMGRGRGDLVKFVDSYDEFDEAVRDELRTQDEVLTEVSVVVEQLEVLAIGIGEEIEKGAEIVEGIDVVEVSGRIRENNRKLRTRLKLK